MCFVSSLNARAVSDLVIPHFVAAGQFDAAVPRGVEMVIRACERYVDAGYVLVDGGEEGAFQRAERPVMFEGLAACGAGAVLPSVGALYRSASHVIIPLQETSGGGLSCSSVGPRQGYPYSNTAFCAGSHAGLSNQTTTLAATMDSQWRQ